MITIVKVASPNMNESVVRSIQNKLQSVQNVEELENVLYRELPFIIMREDLQRAELNTKSVNHDRDFKDWSDTIPKNLPMKGASRLLNKNAWKIVGLELIPGYGEDPEFEWTGFLKFLDDEDISFTAEADDYRDILKKFALIAENYAIGECD